MRKFTRAASMATMTTADPSKTVFSSDIPLTRIDGSVVPLSTFRDNVLLIVNTASQCGFTPQYAGLEALYQAYRNQGLVVLGFPCNQFGAQEPDGEPVIADFCDRQFHVSFPMFAKVKVNGPETHPLFALLKQQAPGLLGTEAIKWNFTKFLVGRGGFPVRRFAPRIRPEGLETAIRDALAR